MSYKTGKELAEWARQEAARKAAEEASKREDRVGEIQERLNSLNELRALWKASHDHNAQMDYLVARKRFGANMKYDEELGHVIEVSKYKIWANGCEENSNLEGV